MVFSVFRQFLREEEIICRSPKECLKEAFKFGLVKDDSRWIEALEDRNLTVHTYDEAAADDVYSRLPNYLEIFNFLRDKLKKQMKK